MLIIIDNKNYKFHFEIIESLIHKYSYILKIPYNPNFQIVLNGINNNEYINYISKKYPNIKFNKDVNYNYKIYSTIYPSQLNYYKNELQKKNIFFISHEVSNETKKYKNIFYLTPLCNNKHFIYADVLPVINKINTPIPIYAVQGNITSSRRNYDLLLNIFNNNYNFNYKIKFIGRGSLPDIFNNYKDKIILCNNLNFIDYHKAFEDCYGILPLITKNTHKHYYINKLTSTISYSRAYKLKCIIDKDLQNIYKLDNVEVFNNKNDIHIAFGKSLELFYKNNINSNINPNPVLKVNIEPPKKKINLIYFKDKKGYGNFGDELSSYITSNLIDKNKYELIFNQKNCLINMVCIGSYIHAASDNYHIFGSGIRTENQHLNFKNLNIYSVRGPLTKSHLEKKNIKCPDIFGDPALLLPKFYKPVIINELKQKIGIIPHKSNYEQYKNKKLGPIYILINPNDKWQNVINKINSCKAIISSSLHGLICSDAYKIPNIWLNEYELQEGDFKFKDYFLSQERPYFNIKSINEFKENNLYNLGNKIDLIKLQNAFPFS